MSNRLSEEYIPDDTYPFITPVERWSYVGRVYALLFVLLGATAAQVISAFRL